MYGKIYDAGRHPQDQRKISIGVNLNQKYDYDQYRKVKAKIKVADSQIQIMSINEIVMRVAVIGYYVYFFESGKTDKYKRAQIFAWLLVHFLSILFAYLTLSSMLKSEVTDFKTYFRLKV